MTTAVVASAPTGDFLAGPGPRAGPAYLEWRPWQRPWSPAAAASSARTWPARSPTRGDDLRLLARRSSKLGHLDEVEFERATGDVTDRRAVRRAMQGVDRVFHVAGPDLAARGGPRRPSSPQTCAARGSSSRRPSRRRSSASFTRRARARSGSRSRRAPPTRSTPFEIGHLGIAYVNSKHEAELEAFRLAAHGLDVVIVNPTFVLGPDDPSRTSMGLVRRFCLGQIPAYVDGALNIVDVRDVAAGHLLADEKGEVGERYILGGRNFTFDRLFADLARISGVAPAAAEAARARSRSPALGRPPGSACRCRRRRRRSSRHRCGGPTATEGPQRARLSSPARTRRPSRTRSTGSSTELGDRAARRAAPQGLAMRGASAGRCGR